MVFGYHIQNKEYEQVKQSSGDGSQSVKHVPDTSDDTMSNSSSVPPSTAVADDVLSAQQLLTANGRTLVYRHGLANGMPAQAE